MPAARDRPNHADQFEGLMNLYKHHLDLFWKWITLYVSIVAALSAYIFKNEISPETRRLFPILIAVASLGIGFGCLIMWSWLKELQKEVRRISDEMESFQYPSFLGMSMTKGALIATSLFAAFSVAYSVYGNF